MPDYPQLAAQIVAFLVPVLPYLQSIPTGAAERIGAATVEQAGKLLNGLRQRFQQEKNNKAKQTLDLFEQDPATFQGALAGVLLPILQANPEWATEIRDLLAQPALQEIIATNNSLVEEITFSLTGSGTQRIQADNSIVCKVKFTKK